MMYPYTWFSNPMLFAQLGNAEQIQRERLEQRA